MGVGVRWMSRVGAALAIVLSGHGAWAAGPSKDQCIDAHSRGQDAREAGQLSLASRLFLTCAQPSCPALVQGDCARFTDELERVQPTVSFAARDSKGRDLPDTAVYVDGALMSTRLEDGRVHDVDPGHHEVRFVNGGRDSILTIVATLGDKGRVVLATFPAPTEPEGVAPVAPAVSAPARPSPRAEAAPASTRPTFPLVVVGAGIVTLGAGITLGVVGLEKVPSSCSVSSHQCAAPPGDSVFDRAKSGMTWSDIGIGLAAGGLATTVAGLVWYFTAPRNKETASAGSAIVPWATASGGGVAVTGRL